MKALKCDCSTMLWLFMKMVDIVPVKCGVQSHLGARHPTGFHQPGALHGYLRQNKSEGRCQLCGTTYYFS